MPGAGPALDIDDPLFNLRVFADQRSYYYLRAEWETDLLPFDGLAAQISYRTDEGKSVEGYGIWDRVAASKHHRAATSLTRKYMHYADMVNGRVQLWLDDVLLHESLLEKEPSDFPPETSHIVYGPDLLGAGETLGSGVRGKLREYEVGRYPPAK